MRYYIVDAFTDKLFGGNPAGVCLLNEWPDKDVMQNIAAENNLAETAFLVKRENYYDLRWFTLRLKSIYAVTLLWQAALSLQIFDPEARTMGFETQSGTLTVTKRGDLYEMDFPARLPQKIEVTQLMSKAIGMPVLEAHLSRDLLLLVDSEQDVKDLTPDLSLLKQIPDCFAVIVTARGETADFVSRFFAPNAGIPEDPVTGSSHSTLIPFWAERLEKEQLTAKQLSKRGGVLYCENCGERVKIAGKAVLYLQGEINV